jgi:hypothetical protein
MAMRLDGLDNQSFGLAVVGYQFPLTNPTGTTFDHDANWLLVDLEGANGDRRMAFRDPAVLTTELNRLVAWFEGIETALPTRTRFDFLEPTLGFELISVATEGPTIRVEFNVQLEEDDQYFFRTDIPVTFEALRSAIADLRSDLVRFPIRR